MNKSLHNQTVEELLEKLDGDLPEELPSDKYTEETMRFIATYGLEAGSNPISPVILHRLFNLFTTEEKISQHTCTIRLSKFLPFESGRFKLNTTTMQIGKSLYDLLEKRPIRKNKSLNFQKKMSQFLSDKNIIQGHYYLPWYVFYYMFQEWCRDTNKNVFLDAKAFKRFLSINFQRKKLDATAHWFGIDKEHIRKSLSEQQEQDIEDWKDAQKNWHETIRFKIPRTKPEEEPTE